MDRGVRSRPPRALTRPTPTGSPTTKTPEQVADATLKSIERDRGEIDVAPLGLKLGAKFGGLAPELAAFVTRKTGSFSPAWPSATARSVAP